MEVFAGRRTAEQSAVTRLRRSPKLGRSFGRRQPRNTESRVRELIPARLSWCLELAPQATAYERPCDRRTVAVDRCSRPRAGQRSRRAQGRKRAVAEHGSRGALRNEQPVSAFADAQSERRSFLEQDSNRFVRHRIPRFSGTGPRWCTPMNPEPGPPRPTLAGIPRLREQNRESRTTPTARVLASTATVPRGDPSSECRVTFNAESRQCPRTPNGRAANLTHVRGEDGRSRPVGCAQGRRCCARDDSSRSAAFIATVARVARPAERSASARKVRRIS